MGMLSDTNADVDVDRRSKEGRDMWQWGNVGNDVIIEPTVDVV